MLKRMWIALSQLWTTPPRNPELHFGTSETADRERDARLFPGQPLH